MSIHKINVKFIEFLLFFNKNIEMSIKCAKIKKEIQDLYKQLVHILW